MQAKETDGLTVNVVSSDSQHALPFGNNDVTKPPANSLIMLTALIVDANGDPAPAGVDVWWQCPDFHDDMIFYWPLDEKGNPGTVQYGTGHSQTDDNGIATIFNSATSNIILEVQAYLTQPSNKKEEGNERSEVTLLGGNNYQMVSYVAFSDTDAVLKRPRLDTNNGFISVTNVDGGDPSPSKEFGPVIAQVPLAIKNEDPPKDGSTKYIVWALPANDPTGRGQLIQDIKTWRGENLSPSISYGFFTQNEKTQSTKNSVAYFMFGDRRPYQSEVNTFSFRGVPLVRPNNLPIYQNPALKPVMLDSGIDENEAEFPTKRHDIIFIPDNRTITYRDLDSALYLNFAIPAPTDAEGQDNYSDNDVIKATIWLNGWLPNGDVLQTDILNFPTKYGKDFKKNYGTDGKTYLPIFIPYTNLADFCQGPQGPGYMWIMYTYNGLNSMLPIQNGSYPARINFTKPPSGNLERK
ncbi:hypothetical protein M1D80_00535 (plasmid) [Phyllobacteriaceae bacterium JZ32]